MGGGNGFGCCAGRLVRNGFERLAARHPAMTRPLRRSKGRGSPAAVAASAVEAAKSQHTTVPAQHVGEEIVAALAKEILTLNEELQNWMQ